jgi:hypothetical protein
VTGNYTPRRSSGKGMDWQVEGRDQRGQPARHQTPGDIVGTPGNVISECPGDIAGIRIPGTVSPWKYRWT